MAISGERPLGISSLCMRRHDDEQPDCIIMILGTLRVYLQTAPRDRRIDSAEQILVLATARRRKPERRQEPDHLISELPGIEQGVSSTYRSCAVAWTPRRLSFRL